MTKAKTNRIDMHPSAFSRVVAAVADRYDNGDGPLPTVTIKHRDEVGVMAIAEAADEVAVFVCFDDADDHVQQINVDTRSEVEWLLGALTRLVERSALQRGPRWAS